MNWIPTTTIVGFHLKKYISIGLGIAGMGSGIGTFMFPMLLRYLEEKYGWRGAFLVIAGITFNLCVFGALYRPQAAKPIEIAHPQQSNKSKHLIDSLQVHIFKNVIFVLLMIQMVFVWTNMGIVHVHIAAYIIHKGYTKTQAAIVVAAMGVAFCIGKRLCWVNGFCV